MRSNSLTDFAKRVDGSDLSGTDVVGSAWKNAKGVPGGSDKPFAIL
jgi:hypothetical protein